MRNLRERIGEWSDNRSIRKREATELRERELEEIRRFIRDDNLFYVLDEDGQSTLVRLDEDAKHIKQALKHLIRQRREELISADGRYTKHQTQTDKLPPQQPSSTINLARL